MIAFEKQVDITVRTFGRMLTNHPAGVCANYSMYGNMRLDYTSEKEHKYWGRFNIHYYTGNRFPVPSLSRLISPPFQWCV